MMKTIELSGDVGFEITAAGLKSQLGDGREPVLLKVDSYGGSVFEAVRLYNAIKDYKGKTTVELGAVAASAASYFPLAADEILVRPNTTFMIHKAWSFVIGNADTMKSEAMVLDGLDSLLADAYVAKTGYDKKDILQSMRDELWLFGGEDIMAAGFADAMIEDEDPAPGIEQPVAMARLEQVRMRLNDSERYAEDMRRAAKTFVSTPALPADNNQPEVDMESPTTDEARAQATSDVAAIAAERERVASLMRLGAKPEDIESGLSVEEFAVAELQRQRSARAQAPAQDFGAFVATDKPAEKATPSKFAAIDAMVAQHPIVTNKEVR